MLTPLARACSTLEQIVENNRPRYFGHNVRVIEVRQIAPRVAEREDDRDLEEAPEVVEGREVDAEDSDNEGPFDEGFEQQEAANVGDVMSDDDVPVEAADNNQLEADDAAFIAEIVPEAVIAAPAEAVVEQQVVNIPLPPLAYRVFGAAFNSQEDRIAHLRYMLNMCERESRGTKRSRDDEQILGEALGMYDPASPPVATGED